MTLPDPIKTAVLDYGVEVTRAADGAPFRAIVERPYARALGVGGERITMSAAIEHFPEDPRGVEYEIAGERLVAVSIADATHREMAVQLESRGFLLTVAGWGIWIDEQEPLWPLAEPADGDPAYTLEVLRIRKGAGVARHILVSLPPTGPKLPKGAIIDRAELRVFAGEAAAAPHWATYHVLRDLDPTECHWGQYRARQPWDVPGAIGAAVDYDPDHVLSESTGFADGWNTVATGPELVKLLRATPNGRVPLLIWPTGASPDGEAVLEATSPVQPQLLVWYRKGGKV